MPQFALDRVRNLFDKINKTLSFTLPGSRKSDDIDAQMPSSTIDAKARRLKFWQAQPRDDSAEVQGVISPEVRLMAEVAEPAETVEVQEDLVPETAAEADSIEIPLHSRQHLSLAANRIIAENRAVVAEQAASQTSPTIILPNCDGRPVIFTPRPASHISRVARHLRIRRRPSLTELINAESKLGSRIFGPVPDGHQREFFHDRDNIWIWHEGWIGPDSRPYQMTVRYEVRPTGVFKKVAAGKYFELTGHELDNFRTAAKAYLETIKRELYYRA